MTKILLVGEPLLRISPSHFQTLSNACQADLYFGGSEVNIARTLSGFETQASFLTTLPNNQLGKNVESFLRQSGIDTNHIQWSGQRLGLYFLENGFGCRPAQVYYDRKGSSFTELSDQDLNLDQLFESVTHFHFSGITLALGKASQELVEYLAREARNRHICISFDLNFRSSMISVKEAKELFSHFAAYADIIFGIDPLKKDDSDCQLFDRDKASQKVIENRLASLYQKYQLKLMCHTQRETDEQGVNHFKAYAYDGKFHESQSLATRVLQRVGSGDAFVAGFLHEYCQGKAILEVLNFGVAAASLKCTVADDQLFVSSNQVEPVLTGNREVKR
ncbi:sugar kinase [Streptococcus ictaluri]|uniref:Carbohydrate kinase, PfkB family n=1 Tax=Streptococcus ictaluri 707-05 TaxID=764299 RepID=G5K0A3_9STRE|nr:sugar kinase [Streptococcus ictaluri]EHI70607.1 carbohydrate kinase, PfkB family [Streptococcus ictaluri 707-05]